MLTTKVLSFNNLSVKQLYDILQLRSEVFVVEQDCVYQDIDYKDQKALHVLGIKNDEIVAYTRVFKPGDYAEKASIGRVVVKENERKHNYGNTIMEASINAIKQHFNEVTIELSAQCYLLKFYNNLGFKETGTEYLEDGIPHIKMMS
jgi:ElaA protein